MQLFLYSQVHVDAAAAAAAAAKETLRVAGETFFKANQIAQDANISCYYAEVHSLKFNHDF